MPGCVRNSRPPRTFLVLVRLLSRLPETPSPCRNQRCRMSDYPYNLLRFGQGNQGFHGYPHPSHARYPIARGGHPRRDRRPARHFLGGVATLRALAPQFQNDGRPLPRRAPHGPAQGQARGRARRPRCHHRRRIREHRAPVRAAREVAALLWPQARLPALQCRRRHQGAPRPEPGAAGATHHLRGRGRATDTAAPSPSAIACCSPSPMPEACASPRSSP